MPTVMLEGFALLVKLFRCLLVRGALVELGMMFDRLGSCWELSGALAVRWRQYLPRMGEA